MIEIRNLVVSQSGRLVLKLDQLDIPEQGLFLLSGDNGSGKTSLVRSILDIHRDYQGTIHIDGHSSRSLGRREMAARLSYLPQQEEAITDFTVEELLLQGQFAAGGRFQEEVIRDLEMERFLGRKYSGLSGGERQLARLARALAAGTKYVFLDEPDSYLSLKNRQRLMQCLERQSAARSMLVISHFGMDFPPGFVHLLDLTEAGTA